MKFFSFVAKIRPKQKWPWRVEFKKEFPWITLYLFGHHFRHLTAGIIRYKPVTDAPACGNGPIKNLIKHLKSLDDRWLSEEAGRYILSISVKPFEAEIVLWIPNLWESSSARALSL